MKPQGLGARRARRAGAALGGFALATGLAWVLVTLPDPPDPLRETVRANLERSGVTNPVTAVLLNFRAYDTLLEVAVLVLAAVAIWSLDPRPLPVGRPGLWRSDPPEPEPLLGGLVRFVAPLVLLTAAYLVWAGSAFPGGAFQAGALLGGGGVLLLVAGRVRVSLPPRAGLRFLVCAGLAAFVAVGAAAMPSGRAFLEYPPGLAYAAILAVEAVLTVSIAFILLALFAEVPALGGRRDGGQAP